MWKDILKRRLEFVQGNKVIEWFLYGFFVIYSKISDNDTIGFVLKILFFSNNQKTVIHHSFIIFLDLEWTVKILRNHKVLQSLIQSFPQHLKMILFMDVLRLYLMLIEMRMEVILWLLITVLIQKVISNKITTHQQQIL